MEYQPMSLFGRWFSRPSKPAPAPAVVVPLARTVSMTVTPSDATCILTPRGDRPIDPIRATGTSHQSFHIPRTVPAWGADLDVTADGYEPFHGWVTIPDGDTEWPAVTLTRTIVE